MHLVSQSSALQLSKLNKGFIHFGKGNQLKTFAVKYIKEFDEKYERTMKFNLKIENDDNFN